MLQIVLGIVLGVIATLGIVWFVRKFKAQIRKILSKYLYWIFGICFPLLTGLLIGTLISNKDEELGSWADWASAVGTVGAFIWGFIAITKQTSIQRALNVEDKRPRFSFEQTDNIQKDEIVLRSNMKENTTSDGIRKRLRNNEGLLFRITNISENPVYSIKIIFKYNTEKENIYEFHGLPKETAIVLIPTNFVKDWQSVFVRFHSSANEVGYMCCKAGGNASYYFVKDKNNEISTYGDDKMVWPDDEIVQIFKDHFKNPSKVAFKASELIKKSR